MATRLEERTGLEVRKVSEDIKGTNSRCSVGSSWESRKQPMKTIRLLPTGDTKYCEGFSGIGFQEAFWGIRSMIIVTPDTLGQMLLPCYVLL